MSKHNSYIAIGLVAVAIFGPWVFLMCKAVGTGWAKFGYCALFVGLQCSFISIAIWLLNKKDKQSGLPKFDNPPPVPPVRNIYSMPDNAVDLRNGKNTGRGPLA